MIRCCLAYKMIKSIQDRISLKYIQKTMKNQLQQPVGQILVPPISISPEQVDLCRRLDEFHTSNGLKTRPSDMFCGAVFVSRTFLRNNPDWIAQAANSIREIMYPFYSREVDLIGTDKREALQNFGSVTANDFLINEMGRIYNDLNCLAHHGTVKKGRINFETFSPIDFETLIADFERIMGNVLLRQIDIHQEADTILALNPEDIDL